MKKKQIANLIMVVVILLIAVAGVLCVGNIKGWFDTDDGTYATLTDMRGIINIERDGVSYPVENDTVLRIGDKISCDPGATVVIKVGDDEFILGENASVAILNPSVDEFSLDFIIGEMFVNCEKTSNITISGKETAFSEITALLSAHKGTQSISVLRGEIGGAHSGEIINYINGEKSIDELNINSLNDFSIAQIRKYADKADLCFTVEDLDNLVAERQKDLQESIDEELNVETTTGGSSDAAEATTTDKSDSKTTTKKNDTSSNKTTSSSKTDKTDKITKPSNSTKTTAPSKTTVPTTVGGGKCTITIRCDTILENMGDLKPGKAEFVPANGIILATTTVKFKSGETVFDILKRTCSTAGIQLEYTLDPIFGSYYIEGINNLYEKDCGENSGWMFKVNGWFPNYGCSEYILKDGDAIVWTYTCQGIGSDVGA